MEIIAQKEIKKITPNRGEFLNPKISEMWNEFCDSINVGYPFVFLETSDLGLVNQMLVTWQSEEEGRNVGEYLYQYGYLEETFFSDIQHLTYPEKDHECLYTEQSLVELYNIIFNKKITAKVILFWGFSSLIETYPSVIDWFLKSSSHQYNAQSPQDRRVFVIVDNYAQIPAKLLPYSKKIVIPKPTYEEIEVIFDKYFFQLKDTKRFRVHGELNKKPEKRQKILRNLLGFSKSEIELLFDYASLNGLPGEFEEKIRVAKKALAEKASSLQLIDVSRETSGPGDDSNKYFGGLENLRDHLRNCKTILEHRDVFTQVKMPSPKGILLVGMPGCGKSLAAKASAQILDRPLLQLDFGKILGKFVGESELNFRTALDIAEKSSPCVLWIDELEKAFAGMEDSNGITKRLFGYFLTWMQDTTADVYIVATANNISKIPPEFKRKGRFDKIFSIFMPNKNEREQIFKYHLYKLEAAGRIEAEIINNCKQYAEETSYKNMSTSSCKDDPGVSGADIASIIQNALSEAIIRSHGENIKISHDDIIKAINELKGHTQRDIMKKQVINESNNNNEDGYTYLERYLKESGYTCASK